MSRIFVNGDSITYGYWDESSGGWANRLKTAVMGSKNYAHEVVNFALGNQTLDKIVKRFPGQLSPYGRARSLGVLMLGASDSVIRNGQCAPQNPLSDFKCQLPQLAESLAAARVTPLFVGLYPVNEAIANPSPLTGDRFSIERGLEYTLAVERFAHSIDAPYVGLGDVWTDPVGLTSFDGVHPNELGHELIASVVIPAVQQRMSAPLLTYSRTTIPLS